MSYTLEQRKVARKIVYLKQKQKLLRKRWLDIDAKIIYLNHTYLEGKYGIKVNKRKIIKVKK